ncbi:hypothetical protein Afer_1985 [Acidimicrobium ferrooxidans DSM 10331]|uniref:Uncharacterized protein n=1 Tax=Acidimicrobium ferrooxidans (strain DSM 10331 / JCM 15462 / NBRC 103882 / ICP) TaxID=525909 RepID=C7M299_ACIFD|nr:winged helix-turn-helix domain-containing protein [Acidimicrobium ferrooxidans]ACU54888.1 hypothetical protein Afer_1985 [Acidimicrobium ferrooxidans DSM 10331]
MVAEDAEHAALDTGIESRTSRQPSAPTWTFLTNHGHVLVCIARDPGIRIRDIAERVGITERAAQGIVADLIRAGYVVRTRIGRRNHYEIDPTRPVRHPVEQPHLVGDLLGALAALSDHDTLGSRPGTETLTGSSTSGR